MANVKKYINNSFQIVFDILEKALVAVTLGIDFGKNAKVYLRISYVKSLENIKEGMNRLECYFNNNMDKLLYVYRFSKDEEERRKYRKNVTN